jgi:hypothetical protein
MRRIATPCSLPFSLPETLLTCAFYYFYRLPLSVLSYLTECDFLFGDVGFAFGGEFF